MNDDLTEALDRIAALAEAALSTISPTSQANIDFRRHVNPAHMLEVVGMVRALREQEANYRKRIRDQRDAAEAEVQRLRDGLADLRGEHRMQMQQGIDAYNLVEKHPGEAAVLLHRALGCLEDGMGRATWRCGSDRVAVQMLYRDIKRELPRLSGGVIGGDDD